MSTISCSMTLWDFQVLLLYKNHELGCQIPTPTGLISSFMAESWIHTTRQGLLSRGGANGTMMLGREFGQSGFPKKSGVRNIHVRPQRAQDRAHGGCPLSGSLSRSLCLCSQPHADPMVSLFLKSCSRAWNLLARDLSYHSHGTGGKEKRLGARALPGLPLRSSTAPGPQQAPPHSS